MLDQVEYICPPHKHNNPRHKKLEKAEQMILRLRSDSRQRLTVAIHEAGHKLAADKLGLRSRYLGPSIEHIKETNQWVVAFGRTEIDDGGVARLSAEQVAYFAAAGCAAEIVLLGFTPDETRECDLDIFLTNIQGSPSALILIYKQAEERMVRELSESIPEQHARIYEAQRFEQTIWPELAAQKVNSNEWHSKKLRTGRFPKLRDAT